MNTYAKYCPNVFVAKCTEEHEKGEVIPLTTKYGKENECIVFNLVGKKDGFFIIPLLGLMALMCKSTQRERQKDTKEQQQPQRQKVRHIMKPQTKAEHFYRWESL